ncbi:MAG: hypothetical protein WBA41_05085 [Rivularia sp. (in: cyanobacteria)]
MFNQKLIPSILIGLSTVFISSKVLAESTNVEFSGAVSPVTSIEYLDQPPATLNGGFSSDTFEAIDPTILRLNTTAPINVQVAAPVPVDLTDPDGTQYTGYLQYDGGEVEHDTPVSISETGEVDLGVRMKVVRPQAFPAGEYTYMVRLSITAQ